MKNNKFYWLAALSIILIIVAVIVSKKKKENASIGVEFEKVAKQDIVQTVSASGKIYPVEEVKISSDVSGEIIELYVEEGQMVTQGQLLARIKPESYQAFVEQSEANLNNAKSNEANLKSRLKQVEAQLLNAETNYKRNKTLYDKKIISKVDYENAETSYKSAQAEYNAGKDAINAANFTVKAAAANIKDAKNNLNKTTIYAPMSGIVSLLNVKKGEKVVGTLQMSGTEMMRIANFDAMEVRVDVSESEIIKVKVGDTADVEIDAYLDRKFIGIVSQVANTSKGASAIAGMTADQSTNFVVKIQIQRTSYNDILAENAKPFLPGMSATVDIKTKKRNNAIAVPIQAVVARDTNINGIIKSNEFVFIKTNGIAQQRIVKTGIQNESHIEILSGLKGNETVITGPYNVINKTLKNGDKITLYKIPTKKKDKEEEEE